MSDLALTMTRHLPVPPEVVFDAWTTPDYMANWLSPMTTASIPKLELKVGGEFQIDMHGEDKDYVHTGKYIEIDRPNKLVFSWFSEGTGQQETIVTLDIQAEKDGSLLTLTHERFTSEESQKSHEGGWTRILERLDEVLSKRASA